MPELPDIVIYIEALQQRILDQTLERIDISAPFLLRTAVPPIKSVEGRKVVQLRRLGKRICIGFEEDFWLVLHLMIAGRLHWREGAYASKASPKISTPPKNHLATFRFTNGTLSLTEAGAKRRASLHLIQGEDSLQRFDPGGLEIFEIDRDRFAKVLQSANHTLKRALTDPRLFSGIGNAYSDEILFDARLSPIALTQKLSSEQIERLFESTRSTLTKWIDLLRAEVVAQASGSRRGVQPSKSRVQAARSRGEEGRHAPAPVGAIASFPEKVTAFRPEMAVHGKYQQSCLRCGQKIQRIRYASNETNYCPGCQTNGKLLADRALSRLLRADWPRTPEELEGLTREQ
jgi:formamidopyrimidine-DNA glycosylase